MAPRAALDEAPKVPVLTRAGYETLQEILLAAGFIKKPHPFESLVDTEIARAAVGY